MTNFEAALQIIQNSKGISESQLMANKAAYIANRIAINRTWLIIAAAVIAVLVALCIVSAASKGDFNDAFPGLVGTSCIVGFICLIAITATACAINGWIADPAKNYADYILRMASYCLRQQ